MTKINLNILVFLVLLYSSQSIATEMFEDFEQTTIKQMEIEKVIEKETLRISSLEDSQRISDAALWLYNDLGISHFFRENFLGALGNFDYILETKISMDDSENLLVGAALWGRMLCHARLDMENELDQDLQMLEVYFYRVFQRDQQCQSCRSEFNISKVAHYSDFITQTKIEFANPDEYISAAECRDRVTGSANQLRLFISPLIKSTAKRAIFLKFIDALEDQGYYCCRDGTFWTTCVTPIFEKLNKWRVIGIPSDPAWD